MKRRTFVGAGTLAVIGSLSGCLTRGFAVSAEATETVQRSFPAPSVREVQVRNAIGDVTVTGVGTGDVDVRVRKRSRNGERGLDDIRVSIENADGVLTVETAIDDDASWFEGSAPVTDVTITVPAGHAGPAVSSITSEIGDVTLLDTRGDTVARTELGEVTASGVDGYLTLRSDVGDVLASDVTGLDGISTDLGTVKADLLSVRDDVEIRTDLGEIVLGIAEDLDLDVVVETDSGFDANLPLTDSRTTGGRFTGRLNRGGHRLLVASDLGDVSLRAIPPAARRGTSVTPELARNSRNSR